MDLEEIKTFLAVARLKNFTWAADELHVTQSTVTSRIKNLERFYGQHLFLRTNKKVDLSPFGKEILPLFEHQLKLIEDSKKNRPQVSIGKETDPVRHHLFVVGQPLHRLGGSIGRNG